MAYAEQAQNRWRWQCLDCRIPLIAEEVDLRCSGCGTQYPVISGIPILVAAPSLYLRSEIVALRRGVEEVRQREAFLDRVSGDLGLTAAARDRHRDVLAAEAAQIETLLGMMRPFAERSAHKGEGKAGSRRSGWGFDGLLHYLLRDWLGTPELEAQGKAIGGAIERAFPDRRGKSILFLGCGAGGLMTERAAGFERAAGIDLALPFLAAARRLLDGESFDLAVPRTLRDSGRVSLGRPHSAVAAGIDLAAMDAFDTAFPDAAADCLVTAFLIDLLPDPRKLAAEIHRLLAPGGVWINYGPAGPLKALWRFDGAEMPDFLAAAGFTAIEFDTVRATYLDLSRDLPGWAYRSHLCTLSVARKAGPAIAPPEVPPALVEMSEIIPQTLPGAVLVRRQSLGGDRNPSIVLHQERIAGSRESFDLDEDMAHLLALVDGEKSLQEIVAPLEAPDQAVRLFTDAFRRGLLTWRRAS